MHSVWVTIPYYGPCKMAITQLQGRFRPWKRQYYEKRFLPAYSTALRAPQTRGGKNFLFFQNSIRRSLIALFSMWHRLCLTNSFVLQINHYDKFKGCARASSMTHFWISFEMTALKNLSNVGLKHVIEFHRKLAGSSEILFFHPRHFIKIDYETVEI